MGWIDIISKRNKGELKEKQLINNARKENQALKNKRLGNNCIDLDAHDLQEDCINRFKVARSNIKRDCDKLSRREWK